MFNIDSVTIFVIASAVIYMFFWVLYHYIDAKTEVQIGLNDALSDESMAGIVWVLKADKGLKPYRYTFLNNKKLYGKLSNKEVREIFDQIIKMGFCPMVIESFDHHDKAHRYTIDSVYPKFDVLYAENDGGDIDGIVHLRGI